MTHNEQYFQKIDGLECPDSTYRPKKNPIVLDRAKGSLIYDMDGKRYLDLCAGFGVLAFGHNPDYLIDILQSNTGENPPIMHGLGDVYPSKDKIDFLTEFSTMMPKHLNKSALALTGSQAVELAMKTAIVATGRRRFLAFEESYHGLDLGVLPVTYRQDFRAPFQGFLRMENARHLPFGCDPSLIERELKSVFGTNDAFAGVVVEPVQGRGGVRSADLHWLESLRSICTTYGVMLIFDEVFTGFGRSGKITFADEIAADLVCFGKAVGGGFPLSVCVGSTRVMDAWPLCESEALHTGTFFGHPLSCRIAAATLKEFKTSNIISSAAAKGHTFRQNLASRLANYSIVKEIRGVGMMTGIEFAAEGVGARLMESLRYLGVIVIPSGAKGHILSLTPALNIETSHLDQAVLLIESALKEMKL